MNIVDRIGMEQMRKDIPVFKAGDTLKVHVRITAPPIKFPCFYGIDMPTKQELIASHNSVEKIKKFLGVDSLAYLSLEGLNAACGGSTSLTIYNLLT